jgi:membrane-bound metal-dependent hydrolase YbcI (DUF457 family)
MTAPTHITFAEFIYLLLLTTTGVALSGVNAAVVALAAILPDVDTGSSHVGQALPFLSAWLERRFGHRTLTHSVLFLVILALVALPLGLLSDDVYFCLVVGYATHPFLDTMNVNGVRLFYPFSTVKCVFPLEVNNPSRYRTHTGSPFDRALGVIFLVACLPVFLIAHQGYERFIRFTQKNIDSAVRDYNEFSPRHLVYAELKAHNLLTRVSIAGRFEIVGAPNDHTLLFKGPEGKLHSLGREYQSEFAAEAVVCYRGLPARTIVRTIDMANQPLASLQAYLDPRWENQLFGSLSTRDQFSLPQNARPFETISSFAGVLNLHYATPEEIRLYHLESIFVDKGLLTVRTVLPAAAESLSVSTPTVDPAAQGYAACSLPYRTGEWIRQTVKVGDTVRPGQMLACIDDGGVARLKDELSRDRRELMTTDQSLQLENLDRQIASARRNIERDSLAYVQSSRLHREGFASSSVPQAGEQDLLFSRRRFRALLDRRSNLIERFQSRQQIGAVDSLLSRQREEVQRTEREIRAPIRGVVADIRRADRGGGSHLTFVLRAVAP